MFGLRVAGCDRGIVIRLSTGPSDISFFQNVQAGPGWGPPCFLFKGYPGLNGRGLNLATHFHLLSRLKIRGAVNLLGYVP